jgi:hypothetical protein
VILIYILYAFGFGYALRAADWAAGPTRVVLAALFPLFLAAAAIAAAKDYLERRARRSPPGDSVVEPT